MALINLLSNLFPSIVCNLLVSYLIVMLHFKQEEEIKNTEVERKA